MLGEQKNCSFFKKKEKLTKNQMAMKKVPNLSGMKQQHFSKPSPIFCMKEKLDIRVLYNEFDEKEKESSKKRRGKG
jgi:hypothetical protein